MGGGAFLEDIRTIVTQVGERTVNIQKTVTPVEGAETIEAELKAPTVIGITALQLLTKLADALKKA